MTTMVVLTTAMALASVAIAVGDDSMVATIMVFLSPIGNVVEVTAILFPLIYSYTICLMIIVHHEPEGKRLLSDVFGFFFFFLNQN